MSAIGAATFHRNGVLIGTQMGNAIAPNVLLTPVVAAFSRGTATRNIDVDYIYVQSNR